MTDLWPRATPTRIADCIAALPMREPDPVCVWCKATFDRYAGGKYVLCPTCVRIHDLDIPTRFRQAELADFPPSTARILASWPSPVKFLLVAGAYGCGKTHATYGAAKTLARAGKMPLILSGKTAKDSWISCERYGGLTQLRYRWHHADYLMLDDLTSATTEGAWGQVWKDAVFQLLDERTARLRATWITVADFLPMTILPTLHEQATLDRLKFFQTVQIAGGSMRSATIPARPGGKETTCQPY